jgi:hypothetical protein
MSCGEGMGATGAHPLFLFLIFIVVGTHAAKHILPTFVAGLGDQEFAITFGEVGERVLDKLAGVLPGVKVGLMDRNYGIVFT